MRVKVFSIFLLLHLLLTFFACLNLINSACNRTTKQHAMGKEKKGPHHQQQSTLMATIAFESSAKTMMNNSPMILRTIIKEMPAERAQFGGEVKEKEEEEITTKGGGEGVDGMIEEEMFHQIDSPEKGGQPAEEEEGEGQFVAALEEEYNEGEMVVDELVSDANAMLIGRLCMLAEPMRSGIAEISNETNAKNTQNPSNGHNMARTMIEPSAYLECIPFTSEEEIAFGLKNLQFGIWDLRQCAKGLIFDALQQKCVEKIGVNESNCDQKGKDGKERPFMMPMLHFNGGGQKGCYRQCLDVKPLATIEEGTICEWLASTLQADLSSPRNYLQCRRPNESGLPCGKWSRRECPANSGVFNAALQFCVQQSQKINKTKEDEEGGEYCPENSVPIGGHCSEGSICPGRDTFCINNHCCIPLARTEKNLDIFGPLQLAQIHGTVCFGSGVHPVGPCSLGCPAKYVCQRDIGCCPQFRSNWEYLDSSGVVESDDDYDQQIGYLVCPGTENVMPEGECGDCAPNRYCVPHLHGCCPHSKLFVDLSSESIEHAPIRAFQCPGGSRLGPRCSGFGLSGRQCGAGFGCYRGYCCPMECPPDLAPISFCATPSPLAIPSPCFSLGGNCFQGVCCQAPAISFAPRLPVCPSGLPARISCIGAAQCPNGFECSNGGCCPIPYCPNGVQSVARCYAPRLTCPVGSICSEGLCCPLPICRPGIFASKFCGIGPNSGCPGGFECFNGGCCPFPQSACPIGIVPLGRCTVAPLGCAAGSICMNSAFCCPLPTCAGPSPILASAFCAPPPILPSPSFIGCPMGYECQSGGGCCPMPMCPSGNLAYGRCSPGGCASGYACFNGLCCPPPPAPIIAVPVPVPVPVPAVASICRLSGSMPMSLCGLNNACPIGYFCEGTGCCPQPIPLCPLGGRALRACIRGADCPPGYGCTQLGGCCQLMDRGGGSPVCPYNLYPVCQCSGGMCPQGARCNDGICCAQNVAVSFYQPGMRCRRSTDCQGAAAGFARCIRNICICANGSYSNGAQCVRPNAGLLRKARGGCDEFGTNCRVHLIGLKKQAMFAPEMRGGNEAGGGGRADAAEVPPLWFNPTVAMDSSKVERRCLNQEVLREEEMMELGGAILQQQQKQPFDPDNTCLPSEKCIHGECRLRLWPGQSGCKSDPECQSRCPDTFCRIDSAAGGNGNGTIDGGREGEGRCICRNGKLLFGRCVKLCPLGFHEVGSEECKPSGGDEEAFWKNSTAIDQIQRELDMANC